MKLDYLTPQTNCYEIKVATCLAVSDPNSATGEAMGFGVVQDW